MASHLCYWLNFKNRPPWLLKTKPSFIWIKKEERVTTKGRPITMGYRSISDRLFLLYKATQEATNRKDLPLPFSKHWNITGSFSISLILNSSVSKMRIYHTCPFYSRKYENWEDICFFKNAEFCGRKITIYYQPALTPVSSLPDLVHY